MNNEWTNLQLLWRISNQYHVSPVHTKTLQRPYDSPKPSGRIFHPRNFLLNGYEEYRGRSVKLPRLRMSGAKPLTPLCLCGVGENSFTFSTFTLRLPHTSGLETFCAYSLPCSYPLCPSVYSNNELRHINKAGFPTPPLPTDCPQHTTAPGLLATLHYAENNPGGTQLVKQLACRLTHHHP
jgi:hypothetical protein